jgi:ferredoxin
MEAMEADIRHRTGELLDTLPRGEVFDWVDTVSIELTTGMLALLFDFPWEDRRLLTFWSDWAGDTEIALVRELDEQRQVMTKCTLCVDRIYDEGMAPVDRRPACVKACPTGARLFGDVKDPTSEVSIAIRERGGYSLMPEWGTRPANQYLPRRRTEAVGAPSRIAQDGHTDATARGAAGSDA